MVDHSQTPEGAIQPGEEVYDESGRLLDFISGFTDDGFETETVDSNAVGLLTARFSGYSPFRDTLQSSIRWAIDEPRSDGDP